MSLIISNITRNSAKVVYLDGGRVFGGEASVTVTSSGATVTTVSWEDDGDPAEITGLTPNTGYTVSYSIPAPISDTGTEVFTTLSDDPKTATESQWEDLASRVNSKVSSGATNSITNSMLQNGSVSVDKIAQFAGNRAIFTGKNITPSSDTPSAWLTALGGPYAPDQGGYWVTYYNQTGCFSQQPTQYGWLETISEGTANIYQRWTDHVSGNISYRSGNSTGWWSQSGNSGTFVKTLRADEVYANYNATAIPANSDLNTESFLFTGKYFAGNNATAASLSNSPTGSAFFMEVVNVTGTALTPPSTRWTYLHRTLTNINGAVYVQYAHCDSNLAWSFGPWTKITTQIQVTSTDPGEGATLAADNFIAVV